MNNSIFRRDARHTFSPAARLSLQAADASRAFAPEPPAQQPLEPLATVPVAGSGSGGDLAGVPMYALALLKVWGASRAIAICEAEGRFAAAELLRTALEQAAGGGS